MKLQRAYYVSDTFGGPSSPFQQPDADAIITTDMRSRPLQPAHAKFDSYHSSAAFGHLVSMVHDLDDELMAAGSLPNAWRSEYRNSITGLLFNEAKRDETTGNGSPFWLAESHSGRIRVVTTHLEPLARVRDQIESLSFLPNTDNGLYGNEEQFRSSYTGRLLHPDHGLDLVSVNPQETIPEDTSPWSVSYVDRFGNIITHAGPDADKAVREQLDGVSDAIRLRIGVITQGNVHRAESLSEAPAGAVSVYSNGNIDIVRKWKAGESPAARLKQSAYSLFAEPLIGTEIAIETPVKKTPTAEEIRLQGANA